VGKSLILQRFEEAAAQYRKEGPIRPASEKQAEPKQKGSVSTSRKKRTTKKEGRN